MRSPYLSISMNAIALLFNSYKCDRAFSSTSTNAIALPFNFYKCDRSNPQLLQVQSPYSKTSTNTIALLFNLSSIYVFVYQSSNNILFQPYKNLFFNSSTCIMI